jgi:hypothetical protein
VVAGYYDDGNLDRGFPWQNGTAETVDYPGATATHLNEVNNRGVAIGNYEDAHSIQHAVTYSLSTSAWTLFKKIRGYLATSASGINDSGTGVGFADGFPFGHVAWIWHPDSQSYSYFDFGFVRSSGGVFTMVNYPGSTWTHVTGINDHGTICGYWYNPASGHVQGFVASPR